MRFCREIATTVTQATKRRVEFINQDGQRVIYRWRLNPKRITREIDGGGQQNVPYYLTSGVLEFSAPGNNRLFTYYDADGNTTDDEDAIRRISMTLTVSTGTGADLSWEGRSTLSSSIAIKKFQNTD